MIFTASFIPPQTQNCENLKLWKPSVLGRIRTNNGIERINREIGRRTRVVGTFPDGNSVLMLVTTRLKYIAEHEWGKRRYQDMSKLGSGRAEGKGGGLEEDGAKDG